MEKPGILDEGIWHEEGRSGNARKKREREGAEVNETLFLPAAVL